MSRRKRGGFRKFPVRKINIQVSKKLVGLFLVVILALVALTIRITYINISNGADYTRIVLQTNQQQYGNRTIAYKRGDILDRNRIQYKVPTGSLPIVFLLLNLFGLGIVSLALMQNEVNHYSPTV